MTVLKTEAVKYLETVGGTNIVGKWEPLFTYLKNSSRNNVKVACIEIKSYTY